MDIYFFDVHFSFNLTYLLLRDSQKVLNEAQILLMPNVEHTTVFGEKPPMIGQHEGLSKDYRLGLRTIKDTKEFKSVQCNGKRCQVCQYIEKTCEFEDADGNKDDIQNGIINCNTDCTVYKFHCSSCFKQYTGSNITDFCY